MSPITGGVTFSVNTGPVQAALEALGARATPALGQALRLEAEAVMATSKDHYVPVDLGALKASGTVTGPDLKGDRVEVTLGFGGPAADYALAVHEIPPPPAKSEGGKSARHAPPTQWKYLETPFLEAMRGIEGRLAARLGRALETGR